MIDLIKRRVLANMLVRCFNGEANWDDLDAFVTKNDSQDKAISGIGLEFWAVLDPEYPENRMHFTQSLVSRTLLFLDTEQEYVDKSESPWLLLLGLFASICGILAVTWIVISHFKLSFYWLFIVAFACTATASLTASCFHKIKPPSPHGEEQAFWPFASRKAFLTATKSRKGRRNWKQ